MNNPSKVMTLYLLKMMSLSAALFEFGTRSSKSKLQGPKLNFSLHLAPQIPPLKYLKPPEETW